MVAIMRKETTGKLELQHLKEFQADTNMLIIKWRKQLNSYNYSWHTRAVIANNLLRLENVYDIIKNDVEHTEVCDND